MGFRMMLQRTRSALVALSCAGMLSSPAMAQQPVRSIAAGESAKRPDSLSPAAKLSNAGGSIAPAKMFASKSLPMALDVALDRNHSLSGEVRDAQGRLQLDTDVVLWQGNDMLQRTRTDQRGRFQFSKLRGGEYRIATPDTTIACRAWVASLAPPNARKSLLVVANMYSVRGQRPINEVFCFNPFLMGTIVAAAIAIPIAVHDSGDGQLADGS